MELLESLSGACRLRFSEDSKILASPSDSSRRHGTLTRADSSRVPFPTWLSLLLSQASTSWLATACNRPLSLLRFSGDAADFGSWEQLHPHMVSSQMCLSRSEYTPYGPSFYLVGRTTCSHRRRVGILLRLHPYNPYGVARAD